MKRTTRKLRAAVIAATSATLLAAAVALAPGAGAVTPTWATARYSCGPWGWSAADFTATQAGTAATITITLPSISVPVPVQADTVTSTLVLARNSDGDTTTFTGYMANPALYAGEPLTIGPLTGVVTPGDSLDSSGSGPYSLRVVIFGLTIDCLANSSLFPGPFVF